MNLQHRRRPLASGHRLGIELLEARDLPSGSSLNSLLLQLKPGAETVFPEVTRIASTENATVSSTYVPGLFKLTGDDSSLARLQANFGLHPLVEYIEPMHELPLLLQPNDPVYVSGDQWALNGTHGIRAPQAWDVTTGSSRVVVAVLDSGISYEHPDLYLNIWINQGEIPVARRANLTDTDGDDLITFWDLNDPVNQGVGKITDVNADGRISGSDVLAPFNADGTGGWANGVDEEGNGLVNDLIGWDFNGNDNNPSDVRGHGTFVSGIIGAVSNNALAIAGVSWRVQLMALKTSADATGSSSDLHLAEAARYASDKGVRITNHSYGTHQFSATLASAARFTATRDVLWVAGAGNSGFDTDLMPFYPAGFDSPNIISVTASGMGGGGTSFSNYGLLAVDLAAPGENIASTIPPNTTAVSNGTSFAAPQLTGVAALLLAQNPTWTTAQLIHRILTTTTPATSMSGVTVTGGILNAQAALLGSTTLDLNWVGGGVSGPTGALPGAAFTVNRSYTISGSAAPASFTIAYYRSTDTLLTGDDVLLATETVSSSAARAVGTHTGTSPALQVSTPGTYYVFAQLDDGTTLVELNEGNNYTRTPQPVVVGTLRVVSFTRTNSGFIIRFNLPIDPSVLNLSDTQAAGFGPADVSFADSASNPVSVPGSLVIDATATQVTFVRTGGVFLPSASPATLRLRSAANGFRTPGGALLDGNADGVVGDDHVATISGTPPAFNTIVSIPDVVRGPGQPVRVPASSPGLPVRLTNGAGVTRVFFELIYDPNLLEITGIARGPNTPANAAASFRIYTPGVAVVGFVSPTTPLSSGPIDILNFTVNVPGTAPYGSKAVLDIQNARVNDGSLASLDDDGVQVVAYFGDTTGNAGYSAADATRALRVAVGLDSGFDAFQLADPVLIADINANDAITSTDATRILQESIGLHQVEFPLLPSPLPTIIAGGPDPLLRFPTHYRGRPGGTITVPLLLDPSDGLEAADVVVSFDPSRLEVVPGSGIRRGSLTRDFDLLGVNLDAKTGTIRIGLGRTAGPITGRGSGSVLSLTFRIRKDSPAGPAIINLRHGLGHSRTQLNEGRLDLIPDPSDEEGDVLDGVVLIQGRATRQRLARDLAFAAGPRLDESGDFFRAAIQGAVASRKRRPG